MDTKESILIVDDDQSTRRNMKLIFEKKGYQTETAGTGREAIEKAQERSFNLALLDVRLPDMDGLELLKPLKEMHPDMVVILATGYASLESAVEALNQGASAYLTKPLKMDEVLTRIQEALERQRLTLENRSLHQQTQRELAERKRAEQALWQSERRYRTLFEDSRDAIWVVTRNGRFVDVNCSLLDLFGYGREEMMALDLQQLYVDPLDFRGFQQRIEENGGVQDYEVRLRRRDGAEIDCLLTSTLWQTDGGNLLGYQGIIRDITERKRTEEQLKKAAMEAPRKAVIETLLIVSGLTESRDPYANGHSQRVAEYALATGRGIGLGDTELEALHVAALLHDVGKLGIPDAVLNKPTRLTRSEWRMVYAYPEESARVAENLPAFQAAVPAIRHHQERWDGSGSPDGLEGEEIPLLARILAVVDHYDAMTSDRPYRSALDKVEAIGRLRKDAGLRLDPEVVEVFLGLIAVARHANLASADLPVKSLA